MEVSFLSNIYLIYDDNKFLSREEFNDLHYLHILLPYPEIIECVNEMPI